MPFDYLKMGLIILLACDVSINHIIVPADHNKEQITF